jgi:hypothetical protein
MTAAVPAPDLAELLEGTTETGKKVTMTAANSLHAQERLQQRGLRWELVEFLLYYGETRLGSGALWCFLKEDSLPTDLRGAKIVEHARRWVLVLSEDGGTVVTAYARNDVSNHVKHKSQRPRRRRNGKWHWRLIAESGDVLEARVG